MTTRTTKFVFRIFLSSSKGRSNSVVLPNILSATSVSQSLTSPRLSADWGRFNFLGESEIDSAHSMPPVTTTHSTSTVAIGFARLCTKSHESLLLCATSVFSVSLWLMNPDQKRTTETQRTQRLHRENPISRTFVQSRVGAFLAVR